MQNCKSCPFTLACLRGTKAYMCPCCGSTFWWFGSMCTFMCPRRVLTERLRNTFNNDVRLLWSPKKAWKDRLSRRRRYISVVGHSHVPLTYCIHCVGYRHG